MGANELHVNPPQMTRAGTDIHESRETLRSHIRNFEQKLAGYGEVGGNDTLSSFATMFIKEIQKIAFDSYHSNNAGYEDHADGYLAMGALYRMSEQANTGEVTNSLSL